MAPADFREQPNLVLLITDQQSGHPHWPAGWATSRSSIVTASSTPIYARRPMRCSIR